MPIVGERRAALIAVLCSLFLLGSMSGVVFASSENWVEVARFTGGTEDVTTDPFTIDHVEWRIRWEFEPDHVHFFWFLIYFNVTTWPQGYPQPQEDIPQVEIPQEDYQEDIPQEAYQKEEKRNYVVDSIFEWLNGSLIGTHYIHDRVGKFYMDISTGRINSYTIIVEQNIESIPEFPSWIILPLFLVVTLSCIIIRKKFRVL